MEEVTQGTNAITQGILIGVSVSVGGGMIVFLLQSSIRHLADDRNEWKNIRIETDQLLSNHANKFFISDDDRAKNISEEFRLLSVKISALNKIYKNPLYRLLIGIRSKKKIVNVHKGLMFLSNSVGGYGVEGENKSRDVRDFYKEIRKNLRIEEIRLEN